VVFGALVAAGIPVLLAGSAVTGTISLLAIASRCLPVGSGTAEVVLILGMAVGVGRSAADAVQVAAATSGRAIVISGLTVLISLAGLLLSGIDLLTGMAVGTMIVVGVAVAGSGTVLPATLALLGDRADCGTCPDGSAGCRSGNSTGLGD
jgi:RND superfamily putative drug exporter